ncbi:MAG: hypothetical protein PHT88_00095 [Candidatus Moranbacteria bacterium]|nr:hypothetical protein [Candidatus Moranbacteria bacterium]
MKKFIKLALVSVFLLGLSMNANALKDCLKAKTCAKAPAGSTLTADTAGNISWTGMQVKQVVHFRQSTALNDNWAPRTSVAGTSFQLPDVAKEGGRFQLILVGGGWLFIDCHNQVSQVAVGDVPGVQLSGVGAVCDDSQGGALGISGTNAFQGQ